MKKIVLLAIGSGLLTQPVIASENYFEANLKVSTEFTFYPQKGKFKGQDYHANLSLALSPDFYWEWNDQQDSLTFEPFFRKDQHDSSRSHADIRELNWVHLSDNWELRTGLRKVFWGVTEFQNLVDVINQKHPVEGLNNEHKLGQPMINYSVVNDWGIVDLFLLPGFREQTYPSTDGRLRASIPVEDVLTTYESSREDKHIDLAARWSHSFDVYDIGVHWFKGTDRTPKYQAVTHNDNLVLKAHYQQIEQVGIDLQATVDSWLYKGEVIYQDNSTENYWATQVGFEYTFYGIQESATDLGVLLEAGYDQRGITADALMQNDIGIGARLAFNDAQSSSLLAGVIHDLDYHGNSFSLEAERRLGDNWKASIEARIFSPGSSNDPSNIFDKDDYFKITFDRYF